MAKYLYKYHEERGEFSASLEDKNGKTLWEVRYPDYYEDEETGELVEGSSIFEDGFMKHTEDIAGLEKYLKSIGTLQKDDEIIDDEDDFEQKKNSGRYEKGGSLKDDLEKKVKDRLKKSTTSSDNGMELPFEIAVYVPSTERANQVIGKRDFATRIEETKYFLSDLFGGFSSSDIDGGYVSSDKGLIEEDVVRVVAFASRNDFEDKLNTLLRRLSVWADKWGQESIGFEFEGDLYYIDKKSKFMKGGTTSKGNLPSLEKKINEVNRLITLGAANDIEVVDTSSTWQSPMKYMPIKYQNGVLYFEWAELDLYSYLKGKGTTWEKKKDKIIKSQAPLDAAPTINAIARMYRSALKKAGIDYRTGGMLYQSGGTLGAGSFARGGFVTSLDDAFASDDLKQELAEKMKEGDPIVAFAYTDYGGDFFDKVAIEYFEENYPDNIVVERTAYSGKNGIVFGEPAREFLEAAENYLLGFDNIEEFYYQKQYEVEQEDFQRFLDDLERYDDYEISPEAIGWLLDNRSGYYNITTQGVDFSARDLEDDLVEAGVIKKKNDDEDDEDYDTPDEQKYAKGGEVSYLKSDGVAQSIVKNKSEATPMWIMDAEYYKESNPKKNATIEIEKIDKSLPDRVGRNYIVKIIFNEHAKGGGFYYRPVKNAPFSILYWQNESDFGSTNGTEFGSYGDLLNAIMVAEKNQSRNGWFAVVVQDKNGEVLFSNNFSEYAKGGSLRKIKRDYFEYKGHKISISGNKKEGYTFLINGRFWSSIHDSKDAALNDAKIHIDEGNVYAKGGRIENQYELRTPASIWDYRWNREQKRHFLSDHSKKIEKQLGRQVEYFYADYKFKDLMPEVQKVIEQHIYEGQYAKGGGVGGHLKSDIDNLKLLRYIEKEFGKPPIGADIRAIKVGVVEVFYYSPNKIAKNWAMKIKSKYGYGSSVLYGSGIVYIDTYKIGEKYAKGGGVDEDYDPISYARTSAISNIDMNEMEKMAKEYAGEEWDKLSDKEKSELVEEMRMDREKYIKQLSKGGAVRKIKSLENFNLNDLDILERFQYDYFKRKNPKMSKAEVLQILINKYGADNPHLSDGLKKIVGKVGSVRKIKVGDNVVFQRPKGYYRYGKVISIDNKNKLAKVEYEFSDEDVKDDLPLSILSKI